MAASLRLSASPSAIGGKSSDRVPAYRSPGARPHRSGPATGRAHRSGVPSGASTGSGEAVELRDGDPARLAGTGVLTAVGHVNATINQALAVGSGCGQLKAGAPARGERVAKYNRLLETADDRPGLPYGTPVP